MKAHNLYKQELARCKKPISFITRGVIQEEKKIIAGCIWSTGKADYYIWNDKAPEIFLAKIFPNYRKLNKLCQKELIQKFGKKFTVSFPISIN